jgi:lambda family phage portal protein
VAPVSDRPGILSRLGAALFPSRQPAEKARGFGGSTFSGAAMHRLTGDWTSRLVAPNEAVRSELGVLRARSRDLRRNNPYVERYLQLSVENILGPDGITVQATPANSRGGVNAKLATQCEAVWYRWSERAGLDGSSWDAVCALLVEQWRGEGEGLLEIVEDAALPMGVAVQVLDPDLLDLDLNVPAANGANEIVMGVERDRLGRAVAYHVWTSHPTAPLPSGGKRTHRPIPANRLCVLAHTLRPGEVRGVSPLAPVMLRLKMLGDTQEALVVLHRIAASKMGWLTSTQDADPLGDASGQPVIEEASPGSVQVLPPGYEFQAWDPGQPTAQYEPFARMLVREIATGLGVSYAGLSGDASQGSYASERVQLLIERNAWRQKQAAFARVVCAPVYAAVLRAAQRRGELLRPEGVTPDGLAAALWHGRRWGWVDPAKDISAVRDGMAAGLTTLTRECNTQGLDVNDVLAEIAAERKKAEQLGITLDWGARNPGAQQQQEQAPQAAADVPPAGA